MRLLLLIFTCLLIVSCDKEDYTEPAPTYTYDIVDSNKLFGYFVDIPKGTAQLWRYSQHTKFPNRVIIPDTISKHGKKFTVTELHDLTFDNATNLQHVTLPKHLNSIGGGAFRNCTSLKEITLPNIGLEYIHRAAFQNTGLVTITIPKSVTHMDEDAFSDCKNLKTVTFEDNNQPIKTLSRGAEHYFKNCSIDRFYLGRALYRGLYLPSTKHLVIGSSVNEVRGHQLDNIQHSITVKNPAKTSIQGLCKVDTYLNIKLYVPKQYLKDNLLHPSWTHFAQIEGY